MPYISTTSVGVDINSTWLRGSNIVQVSQLVGPSPDYWSGSGLTISASPVIASMHALKKQR